MHLTYVLLALIRVSAGDWPEPRQNPCLTACQPAPGAMATAPRLVARFDLGRAVPAATPAVLPGGRVVGLVLNAGQLQAYATDGTRVWSSHPAGLNYVSLEGVDDYDGDGRIEALLKAGAPRVVWRYEAGPEAVSEPVLADVDADERAEIACVRSDGYILVLDE